MAVLKVIYKYEFGNQKKTISLTEDGIYYLYEYLPVSKFKYSYATQEKIDFSYKIWDFKKGKDDVVEFFANELVPAILHISNKTNKPNIGLVAVPSSKVEKITPMINAISLIVNDLIPNIDPELRGAKRFYDYSRLLYRKTDVATAHESACRPTYDEQKESIGCIRNRLFRYNTAFIILDDVTTSGRIMNVCRDILVENDMNEENIYRLALSKTRK